MKLNSTKLFAALALGVMSSMVAKAESVEATLTIDFEDLQVGAECPTNGSPSNPEILIEEDGFNGGQGKVVHVKKENWDTYTRVISITCPKGFTIANCTMIEVNYYNAAEEPTKLDLILKAPDAWYPGTWTDAISVPASDIVSNEWGIAVFDPSEFVFTEGNEAKIKASTFGLSLGFFNNPTGYYIGDITFYFDKDVDQREIDEDALDKSTAPCVEVNFDNWDVSFDDEGEFISSPHLGSNGFGKNRKDMVIDKGPEGYNNNCAHIIYQGWTQIFLVDAIVIPEGYTFDDLRLIEYDIYETDIAGIDANSGASAAGKNGSPILKMKTFYDWGSFDSNASGSSCGNGPLPTVNEWHHVEFYPSAYEWGSRSFKQNIVDDNGDPVLDDEGNPKQEEIVWDAEKVCEEFGKLTSFNMSIGFFPCVNQCYVDNVKCWFQKTTADPNQSGVDTVVATSEVKDWTVYNLQGIQIMKTTDKSALNNLPAGLYIINGKKQLIKK